MNEVENSSSYICGNNNIIIQGGGIDSMILSELSKLSFADLVEVLEFISKIQQNTE